jgi:hypothetical protein
VEYYVATGAIIAIFIAVVVWRIKTIDNAYAFYRSRLDELRKDPNNSDLRQSVLNAGRYYIRVSNNQGSIKLDEAAMLNDINAVCTGHFQQSALLKSYKCSACGSFFESNTDSSICHNCTFKNSIKK